MTRIEQARRKVTVARNAIVVTAFASFALFAGLARASHPGSTAQHTQTTTSVASTSAYSYLGPAGSATPQVQSGGS
jgi:outer membrane biogenesis lipoprotein LolB